MGFRGLASGVQGFLALAGAFGGLWGPLGIFRDYRSRVLAVWGLRAFGGVRVLGVCGFSGFGVLGF